MQPTSELNLNFAVLIPLVLAGMLVLRVFRSAIRARMSHVNTTTSDVIRFSTVRAVAGSWLAPTGVMAIFIALSGGMNQDWQGLFSAVPWPNHWSDHFNTIEGMQPGVKPALPKSDAASPGPIPLPIVEAVTAEAEIDVNKPDWIDKSDTTVGDVRQVVLSSKLWSTEAEAIQDVIPRAASIVRADFDDRHHSLFNRASHRLLSDDRLTESAVKRRYLEHVQQDFGTFSSPMHRLWLQVEVSPLVRTDLYPAWKSAVVGNRIIAIGAVLSLITLAASASTLFARLKEVPNRRSSLTATIVACAASTWIAGDLFLLSRLFQ